MTTFEIAGQDIISLACGLILLLLTLLPQKTPLASVVTAGLLVYTTYTYAYFLFGLLVTPLFVVYMLITGLSFYTLLGLLMSLARNNDVTGSTAQKWVSGYLIFIVALVGFLDGSNIISNTIFLKGALTPQSAFFYLDLAILFPGMVIAAVMNWQGKSAGRFFAGVFLVKAIALMPALILSDVLHYVNTGAFVDLSFDIIAAVVMCSAVFFFWLYSRDCLQG
jgi:hypothetical protein